MEHHQGKDTNAVKGKSGTELFSDPPITDGIEDVKPEKYPTDVVGISWRRRFRSFTADVSVVGLKYVTDSNSSCLRMCVWGSLLLVGLGFTTFNVTDRVIAYMANPVRVEVKIRDTGSIPFPAVTVCDESLFSIKGTDKYGFTEYVRMMFPRTFEEPINPGIDFAALNLSWEQVYRDIAPNISEQWFLCGWDGNYCSWLHFAPVWTNMGYCYTFNAVNNLKAKSPGTRNSFFLVLRANDSDYLNPSSFSIGYRLLLHSPNEIPLMDNLGLKLGPGFHTQIAIHLEHIKELPNPYGDCIDEDNYTISNCNVACESKYIIEKCGCRQPYMIGDVPVCNPLEWTTCVNDNLADYQAYNGLAECKCRRHCNRLYYGYSVSASKLSKYSIDGVVEALKKDGLTDITSTLIRDEFVVFSVYIEQTAYLEMTSFPDYTTLALFCDVGGALGLILGSTLLTAIEFVDFLVLTIVK